MIAATPPVTPMTAWSALERLTRSPDAPLPRRGRASPHVTIRRCEQGGAATATRRKEPLILSKYGYRQRIIRDRSRPSVQGT